MRKLSLVSSVVLFTLIAVGCGKDTSTEQAAESTKTQSSAAPVADTGSKAVRETATKQESEMANTAAAIALESTMKKAQQLIDQAMQYINDGSLDLAEGVINQLDGMEDSLPDSIKSQIENLKNLFAAKQTTEGATETAEAVQGMLPGQTK